MSLDRILSGIGRTLIGAGILVFLFVAYQLWGTGISEARHQNQLLNSFDLQVVEPPAKETVNTTPAPPPAPAGSAVAIIQIPKLGIEKAVVEGTGVDDLKKGPGHYLNTPLPGQPGNSAIAGHRTTYGAPFGDIGELVPGDVINVSTRQGSFRYIVQGQKVVAPTEVSVLDPTGDNRLTLTTCHPKYSAAKRLIVTAILDNNPAPPPVETAPQPTTPSGAGAAVVARGDLLGADLSGTSTDKLPVLMWGLAVAATGMLSWVAAQVFGRFRSYLIGAPIFLIFLFIFFENFSRLLPANA